MLVVSAGSLLWSVLIGTALLAVFPTILAVVALLEKRPVRPFMAPAPGEQLTLTPYMEAMNEAAARNGFEFHGTFKHVKGGTYKLLASLWFSPQRDILALVAGGTLAKMPFRRTYMYSRLPDNTYLVTSDDSGEADIGGVDHKAFLLYADFDELRQHHLLRLAEMNVAPVPFANPTAMQALEEKEAFEAARLESLGYIQFIDPTRTTWRYTPSGAYKLAWKMGSFFRNMRDLKKQAARSKRPRPGDRNYRPSTVPAARPVLKTAEPTSAQTPVQAGNYSFDGSTVRFQADSPDLLMFDPSALDALREALGDIAFPLEGVTPEFINDLNSRFSVGHCRIASFRPGTYEVSPNDIRPCLGQPAPEDMGVFAINTGAVILANHSHVLRLVHLFNWDTYEMARQSTERRAQIFASISRGLGGAFYAVLKLPASEGLLRLDPRAVKPVA